MNAKNFKKARRLARKISVGQPTNGLVGVTVNSRRHGQAVTAVTTPGTTRHIYKQFKKLMRRGLSITQIETGVLAGMKQNENPA